MQAAALAINGQLRRLPIWPVYLLGAAPALWLAWLAVAGGLGVDPVKRLEHRSGEIALQFLVAGLAVTPLRRLTGISLLRFRRALGLLAFGYAGLHVLVWLVLDMNLLWGQIAEDIVKRPYITIGMVAFLLLVPLALTSTDGALRRMGASAWGRLHRLVYPAALLAALHYIWLVKAWPLEPFLYIAAILGLLALRRRRGVAARPGGSAG